MNNLFESWTWNRKHIAPFDSYSKVQLTRTDISSKYFQGPVRKATVHPLLMRAIHAYTYTEIAKLCRITTHGVRSRVSRFRNRLVTTICLPHGGERA